MVIFSAAAASKNPALVFPIVAADVPEGSMSLVIVLIPIILVGFVLFLLVVFVRRRDNLSGSCSPCAWSGW